MKRHWAEKKTARKKWVNWQIVNNILYIILLLSFIGVTIYTFIFSDFLKITKIEIDGTNKLEQSEVLEKVNNLLSDNYLQIISRQNYLFANQNYLAEQLRNHFKKIEDIQIKKVFPDKLKIDIVERTSILIICSEGQCYLVDKHGVAYAQVDFTEEEIAKNRIIKLLDESGGEIKEGDNILTPEFIEFASNIAKEIEKETNLKILDEYRLRSRTLGEIIIQTNKGWDIYLDNQFSPEKIVRVLKTVLNKQISLQDLNNLEYIDLRAGNKVFYRLKGYGAEIVNDEL